MRSLQEGMREVDANVEIGDGFCVMLAVHTAPAVVVIVVIVSVIVPVNYTSAVCCVGPFDARKWEGRRRVRVRNDRVLCL